MSKPMNELLQELDTEPAHLKGNQDKTLDQEVMKGEVFIGMPSEGTISMELMDAYIKLIKPKHYWHSTNMIPLDKARNALVADFLVKAPEASHILFWDDDIVPQPYDLMKLWVHNDPIVSGLYFQKGPPFHPLMSLKMTALSGEIGYSPLIQWEDEKPYYVDGIGMGFVLIRKDVFQEIEWPPFSFHDTAFSEDYSFCTKCRDAGFKIKVDTSVLLKHLADNYPVTIDEFKLYQESLIMKHLRFGDPNV